jgi:hypothetical protein
MLTATAQYRQALPVPHRRETRVEVYHDGVRVADNLPFVEGRVTASLTARVTRQLGLTVDPQYFPMLDTDLLSPTRAILKISTGIGYPNGTREIFPVFVGRVREIARNPRGGVSLTANDLAQDVVDARFEQPRPSNAGVFITAQIQTLITEAITSATFGTNNVPQATTPILVWDEDRGQALDDLAQAVRGRWYALGDGSFVVRAYPYAVSTPVLSLTDGALGTVKEATVLRSRAGVYNSVTIRSERMDGSAPIRATARDSSPSSPTFYGSLYGRVAQIIKVQTPLTLADAQALAAATLSASSALSEQWTVACVPDATLEPGDTISITSRGITGTQIIDSWSLPLNPGPPMQIVGRSSVVAPIIT